jgi:hypothetical protein
MKALRALPGEQSQRRALAYFVSEPVVCAVCWSTLALELSVGLGVDRAFLRL